MSARRSIYDPDELGITDIRSTWLQLRKYFREKSSEGARRSTDSSGSRRKLNRAGKNARHCKVLPLGDRKEVERKYRTGDFTRAILAAEYSVGISTIGRILKGVRARKAGKLIAL